MKKLLEIRKTLFQWFQNSLMHSLKIFVCNLGLHAVNVDLSTCIVKSQILKTEKSVEHGLLSANKSRQVHGEELHAKNLSYWYMYIDDMSRDASKVD